MNEEGRERGGHTINFPKASRILINKSFTWVTSAPKPSPLFNLTLVPQCSKTFKNVQIIDSRNVNRTWQRSFWTREISGTFNIVARLFMKKYQFPWKISKIINLIFINNLAGLAAAGRPTCLNFPNIWNQCWIWRIVLPLKASTRTLKNIRH